MLLSPAFAKTLNLEDFVVKEDLLMVGFALVWVYSCVRNDT